MQIIDNSQRYGIVTRFLHWGAAGLLVALAVLGWIADDLPNNGRGGLMGLHISLGVGFFGLVGARIFWRLWQGWPDFRDAGPRLMQKLGRWMHLALLGVMVALSVSGWMIVSAAGHDSAFFGYFSLPAVLPDSDFLEDAAEEVHEFLVSLLLILAGLHIAAALKHRFVDHDNVLARMIGYSKSRTD